VAVRVLVQIALVALGSAVGGVSRWGVGLAMARWFGTAFPWGTFCINVTGSLFLGWFLTYLNDRLSGGFGWLIADDLRLLIAVGFTGGYTTFSSFEYEAHGLVGQGSVFSGFTYLLASVVLGLVAVRLGVILARL
jgi:CrcB protein